MSRYQYGCSAHQTVQSHDARRNEGASGWMHKQFNTAFGTYELRDFAAMAVFCFGLWAVVFGVLFSLSAFINAGVI